MSETIRTPNANFNAFFSFFEPILIQICDRLECGNSIWIFYAHSTRQVFSNAAQITGMREPTPSPRAHSNAFFTFFGPILILFCDRLECGSSIRIFYAHSTRQALSNALPITGISEPIPNPRAHSNAFFTLFSPKRPENKVKSRK
jgi:hypothetical protein